MPAYLKARIIGISTVIGDKDADFEAGRTFYANLQTKFSTGTDNVVATVKWGGLFLKCNDVAATFYYVTITGAQLSSITWYNLENCNFQASYVINVGGAGPLTIAGGRFPTITERVVYNILGSGRVINLLTEVAGSILAPNNIYHQTNGVTKGLVIVGDVTAVIQSNLPNCDKFDPVVISAITRARIQGTGPNRAAEGQGTYVPVYSLGSYSVGDQLTIGSETVTIIGGVVDGAGNFYFKVDPAIQGNYGAGTTISTTVDDPSSVVRTAITPSGGNPATSETPDETSSKDDKDSSASSIFASFGLIAAILALLF